MSKFKLIPAVYLILEDEDKVLLLRRSNTGYQDGKLSLVAGHIDGDELATTAMVREAKEEVSIQVEAANLKFAHVAHRLGKTSDDERVDFFFSCDTWLGEVKNIEPKKCSELVWANKNDIPDDTIPFVKKVLENISSGIRYSEYTEELQ